MPLNKTLLKIKDATLATKDVQQLIASDGSIIPLSAIQDTDGNLISKTNGLPVKFAEDSDTAYQFSMKIAPITTLASGTVYAGIRNSSTTQNIYIDFLNIKQLYIGTAANTISEYGLVSFAGVTSLNSSGATSPNIGKRGSTNLAPSIDVRVLNTGGITTTGGGVATSGLTVAHINQNTISNDYYLELQGKPMVLRPNEGVLFRASSVISAGSVNHVTCLFRQY